MYLHQAVKLHVLADTSVAALIDDRFYFHLRPQKSEHDATRIPYVRYSRAGVERQVTYCGTGELLRTTATLDLFAISQTEVRDLAKAVRLALIDYRGLMAGELSVRAASLDNEFDLDDLEPGLYRVVQSWTFWHSEE